MIYLKDIPKGSKILGQQDLFGNPVVIIFKHLDGMYSYCYNEANPEQVVHFSVMTPLKQVEGGYAITNEEETPNEPTSTD